MSDRTLAIGSLVLGIVCLVQAAVAAVGGPELIRLMTMKWTGLPQFLQSLLGPMGVRFLLALFWAVIGAAFIYQGALVLRHARSNS